MKLAVLAILIASCSTAFAQTPLVNGATNSTAQQQSVIDNTVQFPTGGPSDINYGGSYTVKTTPTVYAPSLTASATETCWGSVSAAVSVVGVGAAGGATIKDWDCNRRLNAGVAWRMGRQDIAFNLMCQDPTFKEAAALTPKTCDVPVTAKTNNDPPVALLDQPKQTYTDPFIRSRLGLPALPK